MKTDQKAAVLTLALGFPLPRQRSERRNQAFFAGQVDMPSMA